MAGSTSPKRKASGHIGSPPKRPTVHLKRGVPLQAQSTWKYDDSMDLDQMDDINTLPPLTDPIASGFLEGNMLPLLPPLSALDLDGTPSVITDSIMYTSAIQFETSNVRESIDPPKAIPVGKHPLTEAALRMTTITPPDIVANNDVAAMRDAYYEDEDSDGQYAVDDFPPHIRGLHIASKSEASPKDYTNTEQSDLNMYKNLIGQANVRTYAPVREAARQAGSREASIASSSSSPPRMPVQVDRDVTFAKLRRAREDYEGWEVHERQVPSDASDTEPDLEYAEEIKDKMLQRSPARLYPRPWDLSEVVPQQPIRGYQSWKGHHARTEEYTHPLDFNITTGKGKDRLVHEMLDLKLFITRPNHWATEIHLYATFGPCKEPVAHLDATLINRSAIRDDFYHHMESLRKPTAYRISEVFDAEGGLRPSVYEHYMDVDPEEENGDEDEEQDEEGEEDGNGIAKVKNDGNPKSAIERHIQHGHILQIDEVFTEPDWRRRGVAKLLVERAIDRMEAEVASPEATEGKKGSGEGGQLSFAYALPGAVALCNDEESVEQAREFLEMGCGWVQVAETEWFATEVACEDGCDHLSEYDRWLQEERKKFGVEPDV
jgi:GNAT superfamily N-acetyltransferase